MTILKEIERQNELEREEEEKKKKEEKEKKELQLMFPYGDCVIMKESHETPLTAILAKNLKALQEAKLRDSTQEIINNIVQEMMKTVATTLEDEKVELQAENLKLYFENTIDPIRNPTLINEECLGPEDPYGEDMAEVKYLCSIPVSFIILGKPTPLNDKLARKISQYWGCVCIDAITCVEDEIRNPYSPSFDWCRKTLRDGKFIPSEVVMRIMERHALTDEVMHKGFVISGLPFPPLQDEPSVQEQLYMVFNWPVKAKVLIYITFPDSDAVLKTQEMHYDVNTGIFIHKNIFSLDKQVHLVFSLDRRLTRIGSIRDDVFRELEQEKHLIAEDDIKHLVFIPQPFLKSDLLRYRQVALPALERYVTQIDPQYVIRVDGRTTTSHMLRIVRAKAEVLSLQRVIKPVPMLPQLIAESDSDEPKFDELKDDQFYANEEGTEKPEREIKGEQDMDFLIRFANLDEAFNYFTMKDCTSSKFKWCKSNWNYMCPVELFSGKIVEGDYQYAARFLNKVYFFSCLEAYLAFKKCPRKYLWPPNPKPPCKFIVVGHRYSGRSDVSKYLSHVFRGKVLCYETDIEKLYKDSEETQSSAIRGKIESSKLKEMNKERYKLYAAQERERRRKIREWHEEQLNTLEAMDLPEFDENSEEAEDMFVKEEDSPEFDLSEPLIPQLSPARCRWLLKFPEDIFAYLPPELAIPTPLPEAADPNDPDTAADIEDALKTETMEDESHPTSQLCEFLIGEINKAEEENRIKSDGEKFEGGWIIDGMPLDFELWHCLINEGLAPDVVITLQDCSPGHRFLRDKWFTFKRKFSTDNLNYPPFPGEDDEEYDEYASRGEDEDAMNYGEDEEGDQGPRQKFGSLEAMRETIDQYLQSLNKFDEKYPNFLNAVTLNRHPININVADKDINVVKTEVSQRIEAFYSSPAVPFSDSLKGDASGQEEAENEEEDEFKGEADEALKDVNWGDTAMYCPVAYKLYNVLWKGKIDYMVNYKCKVYALSGEDALEKFVDKPWEFVPFYKPEKFTQPLRLCIVGPVGSGKTSVGRLLARSLGLFHRDFEIDINHILIPRDEPVGRRTAYIPIKTWSKEAEEIEALCGEEIGNLESRDTISQYLADGTPVPETLVQYVLSPLWNNEPFKSTGFVISDFPLHPEDFDLIKKNNIVPDVIVCLKMKSEERVKRRLIQELKEHMEDEAKKQKKKAAKARMMQNLAEDIIRRSHFYGGTPGEDYGEISDRMNDIPERMNTPGDVTDDATDYASETATDEALEGMKEQYEEDIDEWYSADLEKLENIKTLANEEKIKWIDMFADNEQQDVCMQIIHEIQDMLSAETLSSPFEQTIQISNEEAEHLLECGYLFVSRFGRWCPVQLKEGKNPLQLYTAMKHTNQVFPVVHRRYIYFIGGEKNRELFMNDPIYYISQTKSVPLVPLKMAIIGPPKSGKTTLANRIAKNTDVKIITIGQSIRYVLEELSWCELATTIEEHLRKGETVPINLGLRCVEAATMDPRCAAHGYIFDGFPATADEIYEMTILNLIPYIVISLECPVTTCSVRLQSHDLAFFSRTPAYPVRLLKHKYRHWLPASYKVTKNLKTEYNNVETLDGKHTLWCLYMLTMNHIYKIMNCIVQYYNDITAGKPGKLTCMCISPEEFSERQSRFSSFCPGCLRYGTLKDGGTPPGKMGLVHYKHYYYWFCKQHIDGFLRRPECFLPPINNTTLPKDVPCLARDGDYDLDVANEGYCIVCYADSIPQRIYVPGLTEYSAVFEGQRHFFCDAKHRDKFMATPKYYCIQNMCMLPLKLGDIQILKLPTLGFLEQSVANQIYAALLSVATERPKYPGLPLDVSGAIYMGYYLKLKNAKMIPEHLQLLRNSQKLFMYRCKVLKKLCHKSKIRNPLLSRADRGYRQEKPRKIH